jgi:A/G-specific adenine glycosylase
MLQQTQVKTVIPYYNRFMQQFPHVQVLANADLDEVLHLWSGLGYYARARNLHKTAKIICKDFNGVFPVQIDKLTALPGIGRSTAGAILALSHGQVQPILDGNVKRVLTRYHGIPGWPGERNTEQALWQIAAQHTPKTKVAGYTQAIMDLGATVCKRSKPDCALCPVATECYACQQQLQSEFPARKKKNSLPVKQIVFTIIENSYGEVLLEKRPPTGIWGGLWSFPECAVDEDIAVWIKEKFGGTVSVLKPNERLRHTFSHFHLDILPYHAKLKSGGMAIRDQDRLFWYKPDKQARVGLAAPVKKLLQSLSVVSTGANA